MRKALITIFATLALTGCDGPSKSEPVNDPKAPVAHDSKANFPALDTSVPDRAKAKPAETPAQGREATGEGKASFPALDTSVPERAKTHKEG